MPSIIGAYRRIRENPFPFPNPKYFVHKILVGRNKQLENLNIILEEINSQSSVVILTGFPGYGKSQFLNHLDYLFDEGTFGTKSIFCKIDILPEELLRGKDLENMFLQKLKQERKIDQSAKALTEEIEKRKKLGKLSLIVLAIDSIDEYFRYLENTSQSNKVLFSSLRMLFGQVPTGLCVILACTHDVTILMRTLLGNDRTYARRTKWITPDLNTLTFNQIKSIPPLYMKEWANHYKIKTSIPQLFSEGALKAFFKASDGAPGGFIRCCSRAVVMMSQKRLSIPMDTNNAISIIKSLSEDLNLSSDLLEEIEIYSTIETPIQEIVLSKEIQSLFEFLKNKLSEKGVESSYSEKSLISTKNNVKIALYYLKDETRVSKKKKISAFHTRNVISVFTQINPHKVIILHENNIIPEWEYRGGVNSAKKLINKAKIEKKVNFVEIRNTNKEETVEKVYSKFTETKDPIVRHKLDNTNLSVYEKTYIRKSMDFQDFSSIEASINLLYENRLRVYLKIKLKSEFSGNWFAKGINATPSLKNNQSTIERIKKYIKKDTNDLKISNDLLNPSIQIPTNISNPLVYLTLGQLRELIKKVGKNKWSEICDTKGIKAIIEESMKSIETVRNAIKHGRSIKSILKERYLIEVISVINEIFRINNEKELKNLIEKCKENPYLCS